MTLAHHALKHAHRRALIIWLAATVALGFGFVYLQATEYIQGHAKV